MQCYAVSRDVYYMFTVSNIEMMHMQSLSERLEAED